MGTDSPAMGGPGRDVEPGPRPERQQAKETKSAATIQADSKTHSMDEGHPTTGTDMTPTPVLTAITTSKQAATADTRLRPLESRPFSFGLHDEGALGDDEDRAAHQDVNTTAKRPLSAQISTLAHFQTLLIFSFSFFAYSNFAAFC